MRLLTKDITMEPHEMEADVTFYRSIPRECPQGNISSIEVELMGAWEGEFLNVRYYGVVQETQRIGDGLAVLKDSLIMLSDVEMSAFDICDEMEDERQEQRELVHEAKLNQWEYEHGR